MEAVRARITQGRHRGELISLALASDSQAFTIAIKLINGDVITYAEDGRVVALDASYTLQPGDAVRLSLLDAFKAHWTRDPVARLNALAAALKPSTSVQHQRGKSQALREGPDMGPSKGPDMGPSEGPDMGPAEGPHSLPPPGPPNTGPSLGPPLAPAAAAARNSYPGMHTVGNLVDIAEDDDDVNRFNEARQDGVSGPGSGAYGHDDSGGRQEGADLDDNGLPLPAKKKPRWKFDYHLVLGDNGLPIVKDSFPKMTVKRKRGYERKNLSALLDRYREWTFFLAPKLDFNTVVKRLELMGSKKAIKDALLMYRSAWFDAQLGALRDDTGLDAELNAAEEEAQAAKQMEKERRLAELVDKQKHEEREKERLAKERATKGAEEARADALAAVQDMMDMPDFDLGTQLLQQAGAVSGDTGGSQMQKSSSSATDGAANAAAATNDGAELVVDASLFAGAIDGDLHGKGGKDHVGAVPTSGSKNDENDEDDPFAELLVDHMGDDGVPKSAPAAAAAAAGAEEDDEDDFADLLYEDDGDAAEGDAGSATGGTGGGEAAAQVVAEAIARDIEATLVPGVASSSPTKRQKLSSTDEEQQASADVP